MKARHLIITLDYEIFGDGSGDVRQHIIEPTERIAALCERENVPLVIFFEVEEYLHFERNAKKLRSDLGYDPVHLIREQLRRLVCRGHEVQLHLHPQWYNAEYQNGRWLLNLNKLTVDDLFETQEETTQFIAVRKRVVQEVIDGAVSGASVNAYRAGGLAAQPGTKLIRSLADNNFAFDSSVVRGLTRKTPHVTLDYRHAPKKKLWKIQSDVATDDESGTIYEVPVWSALRRRLYQITPTRLRAKWQGTHSGRSQRLDGLCVPRNPVSLLKFFFDLVPITLDYHNVAPGELVKMITRDRNRQSDDLLDVMVLIGHSKEHRSDLPLQSFFHEIRSCIDCKFSSFRELGEIVNQQCTSASII